MERVRSFIAIELPDELKAEIDQLQARLKLGEQSWVKWVDPYSIHLTLKFLGNITVDMTPEITKAMEAAVQGITPFHLKVKELGVFPNLRRVQVAWVGMGGEINKLSQVQQRIDTNLAPLGFATEERAFTPHLTLARLRDQASLDERERFGKLIADTRFEAVHSVNVAAISLMKSQLTREGAIYTRISSVRLR